MHFFFQISLPKEQLRNFTKLYNPMTIAELDEKFPKINWFRYINNLIDDIKVNKSEIVIVQSPTYFKKLGNLLSTTSKR